MFTTEYINKTLLLLGPSFSPLKMSLLVGRRFLICLEDTHSRVLLREKDHVLCVMAAAFFTPQIKMALGTLATTFSDSCVPLVLYVHVIECIQRLVTVVVSSRATNSRATKTGFKS